MHNSHFMHQKALLDVQLTKEGQGEDICGGKGTLKRLKNKLFGMLK